MARFPYEYGIQDNLSETIAPLLTENLCCPVSNVSTAWLSEL